MHTPPPQSPPLTPTPLSPPPAPAPTVLRSPPTFHLAPLIENTPMSAPSYLMNEDPLSALCHHFNVAKPVLPLGASIPAALVLPTLRAGHLPTHILAVTDPGDPAASPVPPLLAPVDVALFSRAFRVDGLPSTPASTYAPSLTLPLAPLAVPHAPSVPLLLLFALHLEAQPNLLAARLLPPEAIEEFPNAAAMATAMAAVCAEPELRWRVAFNQGLWKNVLALGPRDAALVELVQTVWNVTADARRIKSRGRRGR